MGFRRQRACVRAEVELNQLRPGGAVSVCVRLLRGLSLITDTAKKRNLK